jgi:hypothetical protein
MGLSVEVSLLLTGFAISTIEGRKTLELRRPLFGAVPRKTDYAIVEKPILKNFTLTTLQNARRVIINVARDGLPHTLKKVLATAVAAC